MKKEFFTIPYLKSISESFIPVTKKYGFDIAFSIPHTLNSFIKVGKDNLDIMSHQGVVYKISCQDCEVSYVGQTKRQLRTRIKEHSSDIRKKNRYPSVISKHRLSLNHNFDWHNVRIIDIERSYHKRPISEMVHIKKTTTWFKQTKWHRFTSHILSPHPWSSSPFLISSPLLISNSLFSQSVQSSFPSTATSRLLIITLVFRAATRVPHNVFVFFWLYLY